MKLELLTYSIIGQIDPSCHREIVDRFIGKRKSTPQWVQEHFLPEPPYSGGHYIIVDLKNKEVVDYLNELFGGMICNKECSRKYSFEIDEDEISNYGFFNIYPECLEYGRYTFGNCRMPDCGGYYPGSPSQCCTVGEKLLSPVKVKKKKAGKLDLAQLHYGGKDIVLLVSARLKRIFDAEGVTGLDYESAGFLDAVKKVDYHKADGISYITYKEIVEEDSPVIEPPYLARITQTIYSRADEVVISDTVCPVHDMFRFRKLVNLWIIPEGIHTEDFFQVEGVQVEGRAYNYQLNKFYISRKVLEVLIKYKAMKGFWIMGPFLKTKFEPVVNPS